jgi:nicotinamidase/pyrazinamidase
MNALIIADVQNDFLPGGALAVPQGDQVIPVINALQHGGSFDVVVATQDWHPPDHGSFAASHPGKKVHEQINLHGLPQTLWPVYCVAGTRGAELADALRRERIERIFQKGIDRDIDSYSGFFDNGHRRATGLNEYLKSRNVTDIFVCGLATDYCVKFTAIDARKLGYKTILIEDATRGVNIKVDDSREAVEEMMSIGVDVALSRELLT